MRNSHIWQTGGLVVVAAVASVLTGAGPPYRPVDALGVGFAVVATGCLGWRRVAPMPVLVATVLLVVVNAAVGYPSTVVSWPTWIALFTCFSVRGWRYRLAAVAVTLAGIVGYVVFDRGPAQVESLFGVAMTFLIAMVAGDAVRVRGAAAAAEQARRRAEERTELARELHDSLGHAVNVMVMQAGVGRRVFDENPEFAREALGHIQTVGRDALGELDHLVRVVRTDQPLPDFTQLAEQIRATGRELRLRTEPVELDTEPARALHRIVQEAVTNALRHTETGRIDIGLRQIGGKVLLEVVNEGEDLPVGRPGNGLANMRQRAQLAGGELKAGPFEGGFRVRAIFPAGVPQGVPR